jgi:hypothetical protein
MSLPALIALSLLTAILGALLGLVGSGLVALGCVRWYAVTSFEGASGYFVVGIALAGAVIGCLIGAITATIHHWSASSPSEWPQALLVPTGTALAIIAGVQLLAAAGAFLLAPSSSHP